MDNNPGFWYRTIRTFLDKGNVGKITLKSVFRQEAANEKKTVR